MPFVAAANAVGARGCWPAFAQKLLPKAPLAAYRCERALGLQTRSEVDRALGQLDGRSNNPRLDFCAQRVHQVPRYALLHSMHEQKHRHPGN